MCNLLESTMPKALCSPESEIPHASLASYIDSIPDELLDYVIDLTRDPTCSGAPSDQHNSSWHACVLVCRRWYNITLPHIFRSVTISPNAPGDVRDFYEMISSNPLIAQHIQRVSIGLVKLHLCTLAEILEVLTGLRSLDLRLLVLQHKPDEKPLRGGFKISRMSCTVGHGLDGIWTVVDIFGLFSAIDDLDLRVQQSWHRHHVEENSNELEGEEWNSVSQSLQNLKIHSATMDSSTEGMHHTTLLAKLGAFRHLTNLIIYTVKLSELENLNTVLCSLAPTLCSCAIMICLRFSEVPFDLDQYVRCLHNGLNACVLLRTFTLDICSKVPRQSTYPPSLMNQIVESTAREWRFALELLSLLPNPDQLKRVGFTYFLDEIINPDVRFGYDRLPWPMVRNTFHRFRNVERISLAFHTNTRDLLVNIEGEAGDDCAALRKEWRKCAMQEMKEFVSVLKFI